MPLGDAAPTGGRARGVAEGEARGYHVQLRWSSADENVQSPSLLVYAGQWAHLRVGDEVSFVQDFDVEVQGDDFIADPIIGVLQDGLVHDVKIVAT